MMHHSLVLRLLLKTHALWPHNNDYYAPHPTAGALIDGARLTSVCRVHRALVENREA